MQVIIDPYEWMPEYGESDVSFHSSGADLVLEIIYDEPDTDNKQGAGMLKRAITFRYARYFVMAPFPGVDPLAPRSAPEAGVTELATPNVVPPANDDLTGPPPAPIMGLGSLVEIEGSGFIERCRQAWRFVSGRDAPAFRHFHIKFLSENVLFHIIAEDVSLSEAVRVTP